MRAEVQDGDERRATRQEDERRGLMCFVCAEEKNDTGTPKLVSRCRKRMTRVHANRCLDARRRVPEACSQRFGTGMNAEQLDREMRGED